MAIFCLLYSLLSSSDLVIGRFGGLWFGGGGIVCEGGVSRSQANVLFGSIGIWVE